MDTTDALAVEHLPLDGLVPYAANAKQHPAEQIDLICRSITEYGFTTPILLDADGTIIAGHGRVKAAQRLGLQTVPTIRLEHLTPEQARAYRIADNRLTELGSWDMTNLQAELDALDLAGFDLELTGFDQAALDEIAPKEAEWPDGPGKQLSLGEMKFIVSERQRDLIERGLRAAQKAGVEDDDPDNENSNGNTLAAWALEWLNR